MTFRRTASVAILLAVGLDLGGCATSFSGRDRIVKATPRCADQTAQIYFEPFSAEVTKEGRAVLAAAAGQSRACKVISVEVLGLADNVGGDVNANLELSKRRAQSVTNALTAIGLPAADFKLNAVGEAGAATSKGESRPLRRRVDIVLHLSAA